MTPSPGLRRAGLLRGKARAVPRHGHCRDRGDAPIIARPAQPPAPEAPMLPILPRRLLLGGALAMPFVARARAQGTFEFVAGSLGGGWYTMGAGIAALAKDEADLQIRVVPGGGLANPTRINNGQSQMGWGIDAFTAAAVRGEEPYTREARQDPHAGHRATRRPSTTSSARARSRRGHAGDPDAAGHPDRLPAALLDRRDDAAAHPAVPRHLAGRDPGGGRDAISTGPTTTSRRPSGTGRWTTSTWRWPSRRRS